MNGRLYLKRIPEILQNPEPRNCILHTPELFRQVRSVTKNPEDDALQIHTDGKYRVRTLNLYFGVQTETQMNRINTVKYSIQETFGAKQ